MLRLHPARSGSRRGGCDEEADLALGASLWLVLGAAYFLIPLLATLIFSLRSGTTGQCCTSANYQRDPRRPASSGGRSDSRFILSIETIIVSARAAHPDRLLGAPEAAAAAALIGFLALVPVRGAADHPRGRPARPLQGHATVVLRAAVRLPRRGLRDPRRSRTSTSRSTPGFRAIDVHTLTEASQSLGATWRTTLFRVILPNIRTAALARRVPDARDRDGRVHDREPRRSSTRSRSTSSTSTRPRPTPRRRSRSSASRSPGRRCSRSCSSAAAGRTVQVGGAR